MSQKIDAKSTKIYFTLTALQKAYFSGLRADGQTPFELMDLMQRDLLDLGLMPISGYKNGHTPTYSVEDAHRFFDESMKAGYEYIADFGTIIKEEAVA